MMFTRLTQHRLTLTHPPAKTDTNTQIKSILKLREFKVGDWVYVRVYPKAKTTWEPGVIKERRGTGHYVVLCSGKLVRKHIDQIRPRTCDSAQPFISENVDFAPQPEVIPAQPIPIDDQPDDDNDDDQDDQPPPPKQANSNGSSRYPTRAQAKRQLF